MAIFAVLGLLGFLAAGYFTVGIIFPQLPLVRRRPRAAVLALASFAATVVLGIVGAATMSPEQKAAASRQRAADAERQQTRDRERAATNQEQAERKQIRDRERAAAADERARRESAHEIVALETLLADYEGNEIGADEKYKGRVIRVTGMVGDVKKDIMNSPYVTLGRGEEFEIPKVQCMLSDEAVERAATLRQGEQVTLRGKVSGLMMNVLMRGCVILPN